MNFIQSLSMTAKSIYCLVKNLMLRKLEYLEDLIASEV